MARQLIRDRNGVMIAQLEVQKNSTNGITFLYNRDGIMQGRYEAKYDLTYNRHGHRVGQGNLLMTLLDNSKKF